MAGAEKDDVSLHPNTLRFYSYHTLTTQSKCLFSMCSDASGQSLYGSKGAGKTTVTINNHTSEHDY